MNGNLFRIVLVEDAESDVFLVRKALGQCGLEFELEVFDDGEKGVHFIETLERDTSQHHPHLMLLDLNLPKKSGGQILERVRSSPSCGTLAVIILTSSDSDRDKAMAAQWRATGYFRKPSQLDEFMKLGPYVRDVLMRHRQGETKNGAHPNS